MGGPQPQPGQPGGPGGLPKPKAEVNLAINQRENSIIAVAPPDKMMIIVQVDQGAGRPRQRRGVAPGHGAAVERVPPDVDRA